MLLAMFYAVQHFLPLVRNTSVAVFADNTTALAHLKHQGGTRSAVLNQTAQDLLRWAELHSVTLPQFIMGRNNVLADALSRPNQILGSEWTLKLLVCSDRILAFGIRSIPSPAKVGLVVTELLITSPVVSWRGWEIPPPPPPPRQHRGSTVILCSTTAE